MSSTTRRNTTRTAWVFVVDTGFYYVPEARFCWATALKARRTWRSMGKSVGPLVRVDVPLPEVKRGE